MGAPVSRIVELALVLEAQIFVVGGEVSFGVLAAEGELTNIRQMLFAGIAREVPLALASAWLSARALLQRAGNGQREETGARAIAPDA